MRRIGDLRLHDEAEEASAPRRLGLGGEDEEPREVGLPTSEVEDEGYPFRLRAGGDPCRDEGVAERIARRKGSGNEKEARRVFKGAPPKGSVGTQMELDALGSDCESCHGRRKSSSAAAAEFAASKRARRAASARPAKTRDEAISFLGSLLTARTWRTASTRPASEAAK